MFWLIPVLIVLVALAVLGLAIRYLLDGLPALRRARRRAEQQVARVAALQPRLIDLQQEAAVVQERVAGVAARMAETRLATGRARRRR